jgi:membrane-associated phospholipid phosphatase
MNSVNWRKIWFLFFLYLILSALTILISNYINSPYIIWFKHTEILLLSILIYMGFLGVFWDGLLIIPGLVLAIWRHGQTFSEGLSTTLLFTGKARFFAKGISPLILILTTSFIVYGTGNITLISLKLIGNTTEWRDPLFWAIEGPVFERLTAFSINANAWDALYHSAWSIELFAVFILILIGRSSNIVFGYCVSMILLFYIGRFLGVINPVMGPGFFKPELFSYLNGSLTHTAMQRVAEVIAIGPEASKDSSGILVGGVSAMPSLHLGMVTLTSIWLAIERRWTLFLTVPWILSVWMSTVVLGWHYILDGAGGILLGIFVVWATKLSLTCIIQDDV